MCSQVHSKCPRLLYNRSHGNDPCTHLQKLYGAICCVKNGGAPPFAAWRQIIPTPALSVQQQPIRPVRDELRCTMEANGDAFLYIRGLQDIIVESARA